MPKLGYTFYPKDWGNSDCVFELNLSERGLYRELIDLAMLNDNKTEYKPDIWARKYASTIEEINQIINKLSKLGLIEIQDKILFIPSCEKRLIFVRTGRQGGKKSKPINKGIGKGNSKGIGKGLSKGNSNQRERERESKKEIENIYRSFDHLKLSFSEYKELEKQYTKTQIDGILDSIENFTGNKKYKSLYLTAKNWLKKEYPKKELTSKAIGKTNQPIIQYDKYGNRI